MPGLVARWLAARAERAAHNDRDYACRFWWGDRNGSAVGVANERCPICNPRTEP